MSALEHDPFEKDDCLCEDCRFFRAVGPVLAKHRNTRERREAQHILKAVQLSPNLQVCEALLCGEAVPKSQLDPQWRRAYGL